MTVLLETEKHRMGACLAKWEVAIKQALDNAHSEGHTYDDRLTKLVPGVHIVTKASSLRN